LTPATLVPATRPTLYFIGVTTGASSIQRVFPAWARHLGIDARIQGVDLPPHAPVADYRRVVEFIRSDPLSLGALVTTHKIDLFRAAGDLFDEVDSFAQLMGETSCLSKKMGALICHAKDPISVGLALDAFIPPGYWAAHPDATAVAMGAGGSTIALTWYLSQASRGRDRPAGIVVTNRSQPRLDHLAEVHALLDGPFPFRYVQAGSPAVNDRVVGAQPTGSLVVNATGLGKDAPGSPVTDTVAFPQDGRVFELNYRGDLLFLAQARTQAAARRLHVEDGWTYFLHGWTQVIGEVFGVAIPTSGPDFEALSEIARSTR
jgi:shikimate 5-dehydrogenase